VDGHACVENEASAVVERLHGSVHHASKKPLSHRDFTGTGAWNHRAALADSLDVSKGHQDGVRARKADDFGGDGLSAGDAYLA
jgi:hypothetical protein